MKIARYNLDEIDKRGAQINIIWGERSNGKSYQVKHKKAVEKYLFGGKRYLYDYKTKEIVENAIERNTRFILMRRFSEEIKSSNIEQYFQDVDIEKLTDGVYNIIVLYRKKLYLANYNFETGKTVRGAVIGYVVSLNTEQNYAGASYLDVTDIIFEEFMSRTIYLNNEPDKLMNFYCTVDRKRGTTRMWLVGNTISKVCPYIYDWDLTTIIKNQKQGDINEKIISTGDVDDDGVEITVKIAIEYCKSSGRSSFAIGKHSKMLSQGSWQSDPQPHLPKSYKCYDVIFRMGFHFKTFRYLGELIQDKETKDIVWFIYPFNKEFKDNLLVISDMIRQSPYWQRDIYNIKANKKIADVINSTFRESNIFYSDDVTGTDFKQAIDFVIRR